ncbi:hypothetical protein FQN53_009654 [Emmonsiellopsis sp. PD_33]|nr:hypothetical protein FQN53_009654 [Emmonsiellopsis sp. PD_33]
MVIFMVLLATVNTTPTFRVAVEVLLYVWSWVSYDSIVLINVFAGMILAELSFLPPPNTKSKTANILPYLLAILGLYLCSYPDQFAEQARWSRQLMYIGTLIFPQRAPLGRYWPGLGAQLLCLAIVRSPSMRHALSKPYLTWLGWVSYPVYLLHGTIIRTFMTWLTFGPMALISASQHESGNDQLPAEPPSLIPEPSKLTIIFTLPVFFFILLAVATAWAAKVDPLFEKVAATIERFARTWGKKGVNSGGYGSPPRKPNGSILPTFAP